MGKYSNVFAEYADKADERNSRLKGSSIWTRFVGMLNNWFNVDHDWFDYSAMDSKARSVENQLTQENLTGAQQQANAFTAAEAQKQRDWEAQMSNTSYQRQVADMRAAGVNPAMAMSGSSTPSGVAATSVSPGAGNLSFQDVLSLVMLPLQRKLVQAQSQQARDLGEAALINAGANVRNAGANERNAGTNERNAGTNEKNSETQRMEAETRRMLAELERRKTDIYEGMTDSQKQELAERAALLKLQREQLPAQLAVAQKNADSQAKSAIASLRQADAAVQNAATNDRLSDYETSLRYAQEMITWSEKEGRDIVNRYLDDRQRTELDNLRKEGVRLDAQGRLINKQGHLVDAQTAKTYVNIATDLSGAVNQWLNPLSSGTGNGRGLSFEQANASFSNF